MLASRRSKGSFTAWGSVNNQSTQLKWNGDSSPAAKVLSDAQIDTQNDEAYWQVQGVDYVPEGAGGWDESGKWKSGRWHVVGVVKVAADSDQPITIKLAAGPDAVADRLCLVPHGSRRRVTPVLP